MKSEGSLGIWMDHTTANIMEFTTDPIKTTTLSSGFSHAEKEAALEKNENLMHNKEQQHQSKYFKTLGETILKYEDVILFGPTDAKTELLNFLRTDHRFEKIKITVKPADKMTENQQHAFVKEHFAKH